MSFQKLYSQLIDDKRQLARENARLMEINRGLQIENTELKVNRYAIDELDEIYGILKEFIQREVINCGEAPGLVRDLLCGYDDKGGGLSAQDKQELKLAYSEAVIGRILSVSDVYGGEDERKNIAAQASYNLGYSDYAAMIAALEYDCDEVWLARLTAKLGVPFRLGTPKKETPFDPSLTVPGVYVQIIGIADKGPINEPVNIGCLDPYRAGNPIDEIGGFEQQIHVNGEFVGTGQAVLDQALDTLFDGTTQPAFNEGLEQV